MKSFPIEALAHWQFAQSRINSGSIEDASLILEDLSGNGNALQLASIGDQTKPYARDILQWSSDGGSLQFNNRKDNAVRHYFQTASGSPLNEAVFEEGYTIEVILKLPEHFDEQQHSWMGILTRQGQGAELGRQGENGLLATLSVSNNKEFQWVSFDSRSSYPITHWSRCIESSQWLHVAAVNDGQLTSLYVNGIRDFRLTDQITNGIAAVAGKGWNVGASEWANEIEQCFAGSLKEIRITGRALSPQEWLTGPVEMQHLQGTNDAIPLLSGDASYQFLFIPDAQKMVQYNAEMFTAQMAWAAEHGGGKRIAMTAFVGDIVDGSSDAAQWQRSHEAISLLDESDMPYMMTAGNHDYGIGDPYLHYYGPERFAHKKYCKGFSPSRYSSCAVIAAGSYEYVFLMLDMLHVKEDLDWAKHMLSENSKLPTILVSHDMLDWTMSGGRRLPVDSETGSFIWQQLVDSHDQIFMTVNGHYFNTAHRIKQNRYGHDVIQLLVNYQSEYRGGNGWMRLAEFDEAAGRISFRTYSPWVEQFAKRPLAYPDFKYLTGEYDHFEVSWHFQSRFNFR
ncbi:LamG-like jellyroll fold domain-containing protein [Bacillus sp. FJAT-26390]|uniref:LamG-like jellyroll fold domain-containing protein n=1 Tax=Bacillus sp. FJAT-26390 TaxID=1743142 RepID=UPI0009E4450C|nr:LamG-like jellyroll fold domain-containing protein [Bacillus sp. FJAT-26390]